MAKRINAKLDQAHRERIKTSQLLNRLQEFVFEGVDPKTKAPIDLSPARIKAIEILLRKSLPDLSQVEMTGPDGGPVQIEQVLSNARARVEQRRQS